MMRQSQNFRAIPAIRIGLTLIELLVVLVVLTILATVAIRATDGVFLQSRYDASVRTLRQIDLAIVGDREIRQSDGAAIATGFLSDIGRLPVSIASPVPGQNLRELWDQSLWTEFLFQAYVPDPTGGIPHPDISIVCGWRGPYITFGFGQAGVLDGWGRPFEFRVPQTSGFDLAIASLGADGLSDADNPNSVDPYSFDLVREYRSGTDVAVYVSQQIEGGSAQPLDGVRVFVFVPRPPTQSNPTGGVVAIETTERVGNAWVFRDVPPGRRVFRAYRNFPPQADPQPQYITRSALVSFSAVPDVELVFPRVPENNGPNGNGDD